MASHEVREYRDSDAQDVAVLFNESNEVWPGGFNQGKELTGDDIRRWVENMDAVAVFVSIEDGHARGYCSFKKSITADLNSGYIGLLGATPKYHGHGHGRDLLRASVDRAIRDGIARVDLHTWAGNLKAVPLYKKTGFMWLPDTSVYMQNFIPMIVLCPMANDFFHGIDWYDVHQRELKLTEDDETWEGMKVYSYHFRRDNKSLHVKINANSRQIMFFENDDYRIALIPSAKKPLRGRTLNLKLEITGKNPGQKEVTIKGFGENGITCSHISQLPLDGSSQAEIPFTIGHETTKAGKYDLYPISGTEISIDGKAIRMAVGFEVKPVVKVGISPKVPVIARGKMSHVKLELSNNAEAPIQGRIILPQISNGNIKCDNPSFSLSVDGKESIELDVELTKPAVIPISIEYSINGEKGITAPIDIPLIVGDPYSTTTLAFKEQDYFTPEVRTCRDNMVMSVRSKGSFVNIFDAGSCDSLFRFSSTSFGPPYEPNMMNHQNYIVKSMEDGTVEISASIDKNRNLFYTRKIHLIGSGWIAFHNRIENRGTLDTAIGMKLTARPNVDTGEINFVQSGQIRSGMLIHERYPAEDEIPIDRSKYDEGWLSIKISNGIWGLVFGTDVRKIEQGWNGLTFEYRFGIIPAGGVVESQPMFTYCGPGDHEIIRSGWLRLAEKRFEKLPILEKSRLRQLSTIPAVPVVCGETDCEVVFDSFRLASESGEITLTAGKGIELSETSFEYKDILRDKPFSKPVHINASGKKEGVSSIKIFSDSDGGSTKSESLVLKMKPDANVKITKKGAEYIVSNKILTFRVDPAFGGGIHSIRAMNREWLKSSYPDLKAIFCWYNPWRGGIRPVLKSFDDWLDCGYKETWDIAECSDELQGIAFKGIETRTVVSRRDELKGVEMRSRYMLCEGHRILRINLFIRNISNIDYKGTFGFEFFQDIHPEYKTHQYFEYGQEKSRKSGPFSAFHPVDDWLFTENDDTGQGLLILQQKIRPESGFRHFFGVADHGIPYGQHALSEIRLDIDANETRAFEYFVVPCVDKNEAMMLRKLTDLK